MSEPKGVSIKGGAATAISPEGAIRLVLNLDESWLSQIQQHVPFDPTLSDLKISINIQAGDTTSTFSIDHQTWPTSHTHNGQTHIFDETSPIRLTSVKQDGLDINVGQGESAEVWKAKWLIGKEWQEDEKALNECKGKGKEVSDRKRISSTSAPDYDIDMSVQTGKRVSAEELADRARHKRQKMVDAFPSGLFGPLPDPPPPRDLNLAKPYIAGDNLHHLAKLPSHHQLPPPAAHSYRDIRVYFYDGTDFFCKVKSTTKMAKLYAAVADRLGTEEKDVSLMVDGLRVGRDHTAEDLERLLPAGTDLRDNMIYMDLSLDQCGGKPVIYLYPPEQMSVDVALSLCPQWNMSAVYPPTRVLTFRPNNEQSKEDWEQVKWNVEAQSDGSMVDKATGLEVSYLFWEAETNPYTAGTQEHTRMQNAGTRLLKSFDPSYTRLYPDQANVVVMKSSDVSIYLDRALKALGLHTEARTSFITYWLPHYQRHSHVALTFVPQDLYSESAPLKIAPTPDIVTRVFMLFGKVNPDQLQAWSKSVKKTEEDVMFWRDVVGVAEREIQEDKGLFRVVEWGGMEIR